MNIEQQVIGGVLGGKAEDFVDARDVYFNGDLQDYLRRKLLDEGFKKLTDFLDEELGTVLSIPEFIVSWVRRETEYVIDGQGTAGGSLLVQHFTELVNENCENGSEMIADSTQEMLWVCYWCLSLFEAFFEMQDDLVEGFTQRNGRQTWHTLEDTESTHIQDAFFFEQFVYLLVTHFLSDDESLFVSVTRLLHSVVYNVTMVQFAKNHSVDDISGSYEKSKHSLFVERLPYEFAKLAWEKEKITRHNDSSYLSKVVPKYSRVDGGLRNIFHVESANHPCFVV